MEEKVENLENIEVVDWKDKFVRLYAELENYKKRVKKDNELLENKIKFESLSVIMDVNDDLFYAKKNSKDSEGLNLIISKISEKLKKEGIEIIQTDIYDPDLHEVISISGENGKIIDVISNGYKVGNQIYKYPKIVLG